MHPPNLQCEQKFESPEGGGAGLHTCTIATRIVLGYDWPALTEPTQDLSYVTAVPELQ